MNETDESEDIRALFYLKHRVQDGRMTGTGQQQVVSQRLQFIEIDADGATRDGGPAPYLDYRPLRDEERALLEDHLKADWLTGDLESHVIAHAITTLVPSHVEEVKKRRLAEIAKVEQEVTARLKREIVYWDHRAEDLKAQERAGKGGGRFNARQAEARANELADRLKRRLAELQREREISALPPSVHGGALVVPGGLLKKTQNEQSASVSGFVEASADARAAIELLAMEAVFAAERLLGFKPRDVSRERIGYDIESHDPNSGNLRFIEVKGRVAGADTVTVTRNEILTALNAPNGFILAIVAVANGFSQQPCYVRKPFGKEPDFGATSVTYKMADLLARAEEPS